MSQLHMSDIDVISNLSKPIDVTLHRLAQGQLPHILNLEVISSKMGIVNL